MGWRNGLVGDVAQDRFVDRRRMAQQRLVEGLADLHRVDEEAPLRVFVVVVHEHAGDPSALTHSLDSLWARSVLPSEDGTDGLSPGVG